MSQSECQGAKTFYEKLSKSQKSFHDAFVIAKKNGFKKRDDVLAEKNSLHQFLEGSKYEIHYWKYEYINLVEVCRSEASALRKVLAEINKDYYERELFSEYWEEESFFSKVIVDKGKVIRLDLVYFNLTEIPAGINKLVNLKRLYLRGNKIREIKNIDRLVNLETLGLRDTKIESLNGLEHMVKLRELDVSGCPIDKIKNAGQIAYWKKRLGDKFRI